MPDRNRIPRRAPLALLALALLVAAFAGDSAQAYSATAPALTAAIDGEVMLLNVRTGKCLTIAGGVTMDNNVDAVQFNCDTHPSRRWTLVEVPGSRTYQVKNVQTGKCLTIAGGRSVANNVLALQFDCDDDPSRRWIISDVTGDATYQLRNAQTGKCLTIAGGVSMENNVRALQFECDSDLSRRWTLRLKL